MQVCIVGHGKSLQGAKRGAAIDSHDVVVRLKKGWMLCNSRPDDYGGKCDYVFASTEVPGVFHGARPANGFVAYPKNGFFDEKIIDALAEEIFVPLNLCNFWNHHFRQSGARHPNMSLGLASVAVFAHELRPAEIVIAGMDSIMHPDQPFERIDTVPRTGVGPHPAHDWASEHEFLKRLAKEYKFTVREL